MFYCAVTGVIDEECDSSESHSQEKVSETLWMLVAGRLMESFKKFLLAGRKRGEAQ